MLPSPRGVRIASQNSAVKSSSAAVAVPARGADCIMDSPHYPRMWMAVAVPARGADCILLRGGPEDGNIQLPSPRGERGEAPPVVEEASRFRGSTPIGRREAAVNRQVRRCLRIASPRFPSCFDSSEVAVPARGADCIEHIIAGLLRRSLSCRPREGCGLHRNSLRLYGFCL